METKLDILRRYFGYTSFRRGQEEIVDALLTGRDALCVMPTGAGKSVCYQVPALLLPGITLVISPLISLMKDQVESLTQAGVHAAYLNSSLTPAQYSRALHNLSEGVYKLVYVAPERLSTENFRTAVENLHISLIAVDEAHCVSQWGQDFRPDYLKIAEFAESLKNRPTIGAFTATATKAVRKDIAEHLHLIDPVRITTGFDRPNLYFGVQMPHSKALALLKLIEERPGKCGIVYCSTRRTVEEVDALLNDKGIPSTRYHAGLPEEERRQNQDDFVYDRKPIMVATNAFGMGIDKSNVRFVIHYQMPRSMEAYYQEAGRAGRDGEAAECILLYNGSDIFTAKWMIEHTEPNENMTAAEQSAVRYQDMNRLNRMVDYCTKPGCLRAFILRYFGENAAQDCGHCSACCGARYGEAEEIARQRRRGADGAHLGQQATAEKIGSIGKIEAPAGGDLFEQLRQVRMALAKLHHVPPYIICNDATLTEMARRKPETLDGMRSVSGMGEIKTARYGEAFLGVIRPYVAQERKMKANVKLLAERAQSAAFRNPVRTAPKPMPPKPVYTPPSAPVIPDIDWDNLSDPEVLSDAYLSGLTIREMSQKSGLSESWLREKLRSMDLIF